MGHYLNVKSINKHKCYVGSDPIILWTRSQCTIINRLLHYISITKIYFQIEPEPLKFTSFKLRKFHFVIMYVTYLQIKNQSILWYILNNSFLFRSQVICCSVKARRVARNKILTILSIYKTSDI